MDLNKVYWHTWFLYAIPIAFSFGLGTLAVEYEVDMARRVSSLEKRVVELRQELEKSSSAVNKRIDSVFNLPVTVTTNPLRGSIYR